MGRGPGGRDWCDAPAVGPIASGSFAGVPERSATATALPAANVAR
ncbi:hypothetical protein OJF2_44390 [Aquisphaera giovannonii]|uniref:Uncharacterized protein n=1 Tax=Aquisphaera giovannonii TaxID=406548 RepID=A0A5B9W5G1_9BACT|nr:hypothetical protein OJF2_44390 [Aquisphaera giovannonii]